LALLIAPPGNLSGGAISFWVIDLLEQINLISLEVVLDRKFVGDIAVNSEAFVRAGGEF
jgi:hypothetical protein